jgi:ATP-dependent Clp protease ATP-binding subunit ClpC
MFERYTEAARRALFFSRYEVTVVGATAIEPEHVLVGVARAAAGGVARILEGAGLSADVIRRELEFEDAPSGTVPTSQEVPFTPAAQRVLRLASEESDTLAHNYVGVEHLMLGLLRDGGSRAAAILERHGLDLTSLRGAVQAFSSGAPAAAGDLVNEIEQIQASVDALASLSADSGEARDLRRRIRERLEELKRQFRR